MEAMHMMFEHLALLSDKRRLSHMLLQRVC